MRQCRGDALDRDDRLGDPYRVGATYQEEGWGLPQARLAARPARHRANQALALVNKQPGITIPQLAAAGQIKRDGNGWDAVA